MSSISNFSTLNLRPELLAVVEELGFTQMTPIQAAAIPLILARNDVMAQARTGSGKTAAFTLPILHTLDLTQREAQALILCPTRELATQVARDVRRLGRRLPGLQVIVACGGEPLRNQRLALERGVHIVVGTPGRIVDLIQRGVFNLSLMRHLVLDEADRMLEMGFRDDLKTILTDTPSTRQTLLFSATFPPEIKAISRSYQIEPKQVQAEVTPEKNSDIHQRLLAVENLDKNQRLIEILNRVSGTVLVFCNQKYIVDEVVTRLRDADISAAALHGDFEQRDRDRTLAMFRNGSRRVLVATDVAARGLDIEGLDLVVNYQLPQETSSYVHRIGRTGRAGAAGLALSLVSAEERVRVTELEALLNTSLTWCDARGSWKELLPKAQVSGVTSMQTLSISGGRKDKLRPGDILGAITGETCGLTAAQIGKIEIQDRISYVAIDRDVFDQAVHRLRQGRIKGQRFLVREID